MNIATLKNRILDNSNNIKLILESLGLHKIKDLGKEIRCAKYEDSNPTGICVKKDSGAFYYRGSDGQISGDIFTLVEFIKECKLNEAMIYVCNVLSIDHKEQEIQTIYQPFGGYYKEVKSYNEDIQELETYPKEVLNQFIDMPNKRFQKDGVNLVTQNTFNIMYDPDSHRITIPWRNTMGEIIGIIGRYNGDDYKERNIAKYYPLIAFPKSQALYGFYENYNDIVAKKTIIITEAEKSVLQLRSMEQLKFNLDGNIIGYEGINLGVAVGSHSISQYQKRLIYSCFPKQIIVAFDEDVSEECILEECNRLQSLNSFYNPRIGYIKDKGNKYLPLGSKCSPTDKGLDVFKSLMKECLVWIT